MVQKRRSGLINVESLPRADVDQLRYNINTSTTHP